MVVYDDDIYVFFFVRCLPFRSGALGTVGTPSGQAPREVQNFPPGQGGVSPGNKNYIYKWDLVPGGPLPPEAFNKVCGVWEEMCV